MFSKGNDWQSNSKLIEIGSNDGTFLSNFKNSAVDFTGFEPSENVAKKAEENNIKAINNFFNLENIKSLKNYIKNTDIVCASNVICHIPDLKNLILSINEILSKKWLFIFEEPYMGSMFEKTSYDQIYDEHIFMFSINSVKKIFNLFDFELIDVVPQSTHGGSMRYVISRKNEYNINQNVVRGLEEENKNMNEISFTEKKQDRNYILDSDDYSSCSCNSSCNMQISRWFRSPRQYKRI